MIEKSWLIPLLPFLGFLINGLGRSRISKKTAAVIGSASVLCSFILSVLVFFELQGSAETGVTVKLFEWIRRSEEHTSELQSRENLVCRLLLEKKKQGGAYTVRMYGDD